MQKKPFQEPKIPVLQMIFFGVGVALLAMVNSCGYNSAKIAHAAMVETVKVSK